MVTEERFLKGSELEALVHEDSYQMQAEFAGSFGMTQQAILKCHKAMGMIQKQGNRLPYNERHNKVILHYLPYSTDITSSDYHLFRSMAHGLTNQHLHSYEEVKNRFDTRIV